MPYGRAKRYLLLRSFFVCYLVYSASVVQAEADLAFVANLDGNWEVCVAKDDGSDLKRITETPFDEKEPQWSFDRKKIVYATSDGKLNIAELGSNRHFTIEEIYKNRQQIMPTFSPNEKNIAFIQFRPPEEKDDTDLMVLNVKTGKVRRLFEQYALQMWPAYSPDGEKIAYTSIHCNDSCGRMLQEIWVAAANGGWARQLLMTHSYCQQPKWSPDGQRIVFVSDINTNPDLWVVDLNTWLMKQITTYSGLDINPAWSPDGKSIAFISTRSGIKEIWIKDLTGGHIKKLSPFGDKQVPCKDVAW